MVVINSHDRSARVSYSDITVSEWDGKLNQLGAFEADQQDVVQFTNFDRISGEVERIAAGNLTFKTPYATMDIPLERIATIALAGAQAQRARRYMGDVELYFGDGERITVRLAALADGRLTGFTENIGDVDFDLGPFHGIRFNVYDESTTDPEIEGQLLDMADFPSFIIQ